MVDKLEMCLWPLQGKMFDPFISSGDCGTGKPVQNVSLFGQFASVALFFLLLRSSSTQCESHSIYCLTVTEAVEMKGSREAD